MKFMARLALVAAIALVAPLAHGQRIPGAPGGSYPSGVSSWSSVADGEIVFRSGTTLDGLVQSTFIKSAGAAGGQTIIGSTSTGGLTLTPRSATATANCRFTSTSTRMIADCSPPGTDGTTELFLTQNNHADNGLGIVTFGSTYAAGGLAGYTRVTNYGAGGVQYIAASGTLQEWFTDGGTNFGLRLDGSSYVIAPNRLGVGVTTAPSYPLHVKSAGQPDPLVMFETTGNYNEFLMKTASGGSAYFIKDNGNTLGNGNYSFELYNQNGPMAFWSAGTSDSVTKAMAFTPSNIIFGNTAVALSASGERFKIANGNTTQTVASAAGATWNYFNIVAPTVTASGATNITTAAGFNAYALGIPAITSTVTITNSASLYLAGAPTISGGGTITNAYAQWVDDGLARFDGNGTHVFELPADATAGVDVTIDGRIPIKVGGATVYLRYYAD